MISLKRFVLPCVVAGTMAVSMVAVADDFPSQPLRLVTPYPPGGSHSLHASILTTPAEAHFGQPMISVIREGGGGVVGASQILQGAHDGYTMLFGDPLLNSLRPQVEDLPYTTEDWIPVAHINSSPWVFVTSVDASFEPTLDAMTEWARENPGDLIFSSTTQNGSTHVAFQLLEHESGTTMRPIHYGGGGPAMQNLLSGDTMAYAGDPSVVGNHIAEGAVHGVCVAGEQRWAGLPDLPTCRESGYDVVFQFWRGVLVPADTPMERVRHLSDAFEAMVMDEGVGRLIASINSRIEFMGYQEFAEYLEREQTQLREMFRAMAE